MSERRILESWKDIGAYLGHTAKTCRKWEHELDLPIHRLEHSPRAHVFAYTDELDRWKEEKLLPERSRIARELFRPGSRARLWLIAAASVVVLVIVGLLVRQTRFGETSPGTQAVKSIAVLPFVDLSPDKGQEHLGDGIADILINALNRIEGLRTAARISAFYFKGKAVSPKEIGRKLKVGWILEGSVQVYENRLRIVASLLSAGDGYQLWTERYDRNPADIFAVEDEIARSVVKALQIKLSSGDKPLLINRGTKDREAYNLYLKGQHFSLKGRLFWKPAIEFYEQAIAKDPNYALAYANMARCYYSLGRMGLIRTEEAYLKAKLAAMKALEIDSNAVDALSVLASVKMTYEWDFRGAERDIREAIRKDPANSTFHATYADFLSALGRHEEAVKEARLANELPSLSPAFDCALTMCAYYRARKYDLALRGLKKTLELDPYYVATYINLTAVYLAMGRYQEAREANDRCREIRGVSKKPDDDDYWSALIYAWSGNPAEARRILAAVKVKMKENFIPTDFVVCIHAALGDRDEAFVWLEKAYQERDCILYTLKVEPLFDPLRSDPRFADMLRRVGLEK
jgi:adenylate cyclase